MKIIDPLKFKIFEALQNEEIKPLFFARQKFGTESDILKLDNEFKKISQEKSKRKYVYIDLTPFIRIGRIEDIVNILKIFKKIRPVILINKIMDIYEFEHFSKDTPIVLVTLDNYGNKIDVVESSEYPSVINQINEDFPNPEITREKRIIEIIRSCNDNCTDLMLFRRIISEQRLTNLICQPGFLDIPNSYAPPHEIHYISGNFYMKTRSGMLVSCFLNIKRMGDYRILLDLAYEVILNLYNYFLLRENSDKFDNELNIDLIAVPSNSALFIASIIQIITDICIIAIDKLGPIPDLHQDINFLYEQLNGKRVMVFQEVIATGSETDRTIMFLNDMNAYISKIIVLFNLDVGRVNMVNHNKLVSLCKPKEEIQYVYRSS